MRKVKISTKLNFSTFSNRKTILIGKMSRKVIRNSCWTMSSTRMMIKEAFRVRAAAKA